MVILYDILSRFECTQRQSKYFRLCAFIRSLFMVDKRPVFFSPFEKNDCLGRSCLRHMQAACGAYTTIILYFPLFSLSNKLCYNVVSAASSGMSMHSAQSLTDIRIWRPAKKMFVAGRSDKRRTFFNSFSRWSEWVGRGSLDGDTHLWLASSLNVKSRRSFAAGFAQQHPMHRRPKSLLVSSNFGNVKKYEKELIKSNPVHMW